MARIPQQLLTYADYTVAYICSIGVKLAPVEGMLDKIYNPLPISRDQNAYTLGKISRYNMIIAVLPEIGNSTAATVATQLLNNFPLIWFDLLVSIRGEIPKDKGKDDI